jgi:signal transduction histidine kinase
VTYDDAELRIDVADTGWGSPVSASEGTGHGLIGMRERAASVGGAVEAGPAPEGGYRVAARLPRDGRQLAAPAALAPLQDGARP